MDSLAAVARGDLHYSIQIPAAIADPAGDECELQRMERAAGLKWEKRLNRFVQFVAFGEWAGNAFGTLAFVWATAVLLGGFCSFLNREDFWFATAMIFIEAFRIFSRSYRLDSQSLFGTTRALRWISSSFSRMLGRPQEGNEVVLMMGLWINLIDQLPFNIGYVFILEVALLILLSRRPRRPQKWQMWAAAISYLIMATYRLRETLHVLITLPKADSSPKMAWLLITMSSYITEDVAVLLLNFKPQRIANLTNTPCGRNLISLAKLISALWLANELVLAMLPLHDYESLPLVVTDAEDYFSIAFTIVVLSLGSLQKPAESLIGSWIDAIMHILFLCHLVFPFPPFFFYFLRRHPSAPFTAGLSFIVLVVVMLIGNLQIPTSIVQVVLSSLRLGRLLAPTDYNPPPQGSSSNLVPAIAVFYVLALCQGTLYILASVLGLFSSFPCRSLIRISKLGGKWGSKAIDLYYQRAYATRMEIGVFAAGSTISFANFAIESLSSSSRELQVAGVFVLHSVLQRRDCVKELILRVTSSTAAVSTLIGMLAWTDLELEDIYAIRMYAARVTIQLADSLRIDGVPHMVKPVSLLLAENAAPNQQQDHQESSWQTASPIQGSNGECYWVCRYWQRMKEMWSVPEDPTLTHQDSLPVLGMVILEKLACDLDNCVEIFKATNLISKTIGLISYTSNVAQQNAVVYSSLNFLRRLAITGERIGVALRQELWNHPFLLNNLAGIMEDARSSPQLWEPAMDIVAKLSLDKKAARDIGRTQVITERLLHAFLGRDGLTNKYYDQSLRKIAGEALANIALWGTANCSAILDEPGYEVVNDLKDMLSDNEYRYVGASLLLNLCAHCGVKLMSHPNASEHLSSSLSIVMEHIKAAEGKQLESLIGLASEINDIIHDAFVQNLESQTNNGVGIFQKLVSTLNSNKKPNHKYPRMRRVIVKIMITILESCHRTVEKMMQEGVMEGLMEALARIERTPSKVEKYRVFYGHIGVVRENGEPMPALVARAKALIRQTTQTAGAQTGQDA